jgi:2-polyprenyl-6-methoxyphenol hydroxylase-like FAD-dependent oxidoreductase
MLNLYSSSKIDCTSNRGVTEDKLNDDYDVAVVGYGPTGMTFAALLGRLGHRVIVLERYTGLYNLPRAACFDDETMRVFQKLGIAKEISRGARPQYEYDWVNAVGETLVKLEYPKTAAGGWPALFMMFQPHIEAVLDTYDKALPTVEVQQGVTVSDVVQDSEFATLHGIGQNAQEVVVRARSTIGADGGNGFTRRKLCQHIDRLRISRELACLRLPLASRCSKPATLPTGVRSSSTYFNCNNWSRTSSLLVHAQS